MCVEIREEGGGKSRKKSPASRSVWSCSRDVGGYLTPKGDHQEKHLLPSLTLKCSDIASAFTGLSDKGRIEGESLRRVDTIKIFLKQAQGWLVSWRSWLLHSTLKKSAISLLCTTGSQEVREGRPWAASVPRATSPTVLLAAWPCVLLARTASRGGLPSWRLWFW